MWDHVRLQKTGININIAAHCCLQSAAVVMLLQSRNTLNPSNRNLYLTNTDLYVFSDIQSQNSVPHVFFYASVCMKYIICFSAPPFRKAASPSVCTSNCGGGDGERRLPEVQLCEQLQQLAGLRGGLVPPLTWGQEGGAQRRDDHPDLCLHRAGRLQPPSGRQGAKAC